MIVEVTGGEDRLARNEKDQNKYIEAELTDDEAAQQTHALETSLHHR